MATYCLTCASGFTKKGWKCQNNSYTGFKFTLADTPENVLANIDNIVTALLTILNVSTSNVDVITFNSITSGSTIVDGSATTDSTSTSTAALSSSLSPSGSTIAGMSVTTASVTSVGTEEEQKKSNVGLIVGLVIGFVVLVAVVVIVAYFIYKKKKVSQVNQVNEDEHIVIELENDSKLKQNSKQES